MVDIIAALRAELAATSAVSALVGDRVYGMELPLAQSASMPRKALVLQCAGGEQELGFAPLTYPRIDCICYGASYLEAFTVYRAAHDALKVIGKANNPIIANGVKVVLRHSNGPIQFKDPEKQWPIVADTWMTTAHEVAAA